MLILVFFRKNQKVLDSQIDEKYQTPADFTIIVKNIPKDLKVDYKKELKNIFERPDPKNPNIKEIEVSKVTLVYDIEEIEK